MAKLLPSSNSAIIKSQKSGVVKSNKFLNAKSKTTAIGRNSTKETPKLLGSTLSNIEKKVVQIDKLLKDSFLLSKKEEEIKRKSKEKEKFEGKEKELESKKPPEVKGIKLPSLPKMGFVDWIKNFITQTILGFFAVRLIEFLPQLLKVLPVIVKVADFFIDVGGKLLDGLVTFIDWGYKAYDATRGFAKNLFGEGGVKQFDQLSGLLNKFLNLAIIAGMVAAGSGGIGGKSKPGARPSPGRGGRPRVTTGGGGGVGRPDIRNPLRQRPKITTGGGGTKGLLRTVRPFLKRIPLPVVGALIDFGLSVALGENPGRAAFRAIGAGLLGAVGVAAGSVVPVAGNFIGGLLGGFAGDAIGGALYDAFFGKGVTSKKGKTMKAAGGGKATATSGRTIKKKKKARTISFTPRKIKPGANTGGEDKVQKLFPNPEKPSGLSGFLGGLFGGNQQQQEKPKEKSANPQEFLIKSNDVLGRTDFFGPFFTLAIKTVLGQKPDALDYKNAGRGLNTWMQTTFKSGSMGFAGGGEVDIKQFFAGEDYTDIIARSVEDSVSKEVDMTIRDLAKELSLRPVGREEMIQENIRRGQEGGEGEAGPAGSSGDKLTMARNLMRDLGLSAAQAAGIVGNMAAESGVENARPQGSRPGTKAPLKVDGVTGYGLVQWTSRGRQQALADFARSRGADLSKPLSMDIEYQFFLKEFRGAYGNVLKQIKNAADTKASSTIFMQQYEIPAGYRTEAKIMERYNMSKPIYDQLSRGEGKATEGRGTYVPDVTLGKGYGSGGSKIAGELGRFMKKKGVVPGSVHRHPEHPPYSLTSGHSKGSLHYQGRAIDLGAAANEQGPILKAVKEFNKMKGVNPVQLLHAGNEPSGHSDHVHVAYKRGGETLDGPHQALIGEEGTEYVIDTNSYEATEKVAPGLLDILNYNVNDKSSLQKNMPSIIQSLSQYTDYELPYGSAQVEFIPLPSTDSGGMSGGTSKSSLSYDDSTIDTMEEQMNDSLMYG